MDKQELRKHIKQLKKQYDKTWLDNTSMQIMHLLEQNKSFVLSHNVMLYYALPDEVQTAAFINKWRYQKRIILPTVVGDDIIPVELADNTAFAEGDFHILEPRNKPYNGNFDLIVVSGVAFDRQGNRLGRGRGYYDRFLSLHPQVKRIGICYPFQVMEQVPVEANDIRMDEIISIF